MPLRRFTALLMAAIPLAAAAQPAPALPPSLSALESCRAKTDSAERLACYDKAVADLATASAAREVVVIDRAEVRKTRKGLFGFAMPKIPFLSSRPGNREDEEDESRLVTKVVSSNALRGGMWRFTVEDGAVWETTEVTRGFDDPVPGAAVTIERGTLGAFYAVVGKRGRAAVRRIR